MRGLNFPGLQENGVKLVVLLPVPLWSLQKFVKAPEGELLKSFVFCDPRSAVFKSLACNFVFTTKKLRPDTIHAHTGVLKAAWTGVVEGVVGGMQGDPRQMGGAFVFREGKAVWQHKDAFNADQVPIPVLFAAAGVDPGLYVHTLLQ